MLINVDSTATFRAANLSVLTTNTTSPCLRAGQVFSRTRVGQKPKLSRSVTLNLTMEIYTKPKWGPAVFEGP